ncbi:VP80 [Perigonia lusca single nucleopolyhedrovirus]|uniref:VP80 n=1 Tax=Perigonia lusca single nucleopolyhedrovirus TaxID=1675865 RepID=A0A0M3WP67_9ABAC|nr:VP80 [Perigonia lusca single nucleopolyhedrovirus]AKN80590.1 VP80 [Perigonia lusca single nucleopolyhedrovirus]
MDDAISSINAVGDENGSGTVVPITGDGSCLFRSISFAMYNTEERHLEVRRQIVDYVFNNWSDYGFTTMDWKTNNERAYNSADEYRADMIKPNTFGTYTELIAASKLYPYRFKVYVEEKDATTRKLYMETGNTELPALKLLFSGNYGNGHFDVIAREKSCPVTTFKNISTTLADIKQEAVTSSSDMSFSSSSSSDISTESNVFQRDQNNIDVDNIILNTHTIQQMYGAQLKYYLSQIADVEDIDAAVISSLDANIEVLQAIFNNYSPIKLAPIKSSQTILTPPATTPIPPATTPIPPATTPSIQIVTPSIVSVDDNNGTDILPMVYFNFQYNKNRYESFVHDLDLVLRDSFINNVTKQSMSLLNEQSGSSVVMVAFQDIVNSTFVRSFILNHANHNTVKSLPQELIVVLKQLDVNLVNCQLDTIKASLRALVFKVNDNVPYNLVLYIKANEWQCAIQNATINYILKTYNSVEKIQIIDESTSSSLPMTIPPTRATTIQSSKSLSVKRSHTNDETEQDNFTLIAYRHQSDSDGDVANLNLTASMRSKKRRKRKRLGNVAFEPFYDNMVANAESVDDLIFSLRNTMDQQQQELRRPTFSFRDFTASMPSLLIPPKPEILAITFNKPNIPVTPNAQPNVRDIPNVSITPAPSTKQPPLPSEFVTPKRSRFNLQPLNVEPPLYLKLLFVTIPSSVDSSLFSKATESLNVVPELKHFRNTLEYITQLNLSQLSTNVHLYEILLPLSYYGNNAVGINNVTHFALISQRYFIACYEKFDQIRDELVQVSLVHNVERVVMFMFMYSFLWHYKRYAVSTLNSSFLTPHKNEKLIKIIYMVDAMVQKHFNRLAQFPQALPSITKQTQLVKLMVGDKSNDDE